MDFLRELLRWEISIFLIGLGVIVTLQLLSGEINTRYLLYGTMTGRKENGGRYFSPERVQLLAFTVGTGLYYLSQVLANPRSGQLPEVPQNWPMVMGGSNAVYLAGKAYARWFANNSRSSTSSN
jgi:hypothetical protein